jgi:hypothetical protein
MYERILRETRPLLDDIAHRGYWTLVCAKNPIFEASLCYSRDQTGAEAQDYRGTRAGFGDDTALQEDPVTKGSVNLSVAAALYVSRQAPA